MKNKRVFDIPTFDKTLLSSVLTIFDKSDYDNYYNTELKNNLIELVKYIENKNNIKYKISILKENKYKNKYLNKNKYIYQYKILFESKKCNFGIEIANKSNSFLLHLLDINQIFSINDFDTLDFFYKSLCKDFNEEYLKNLCKEYNLIY